MKGNKLSGLSTSLRAGSRLWHDIPRTSPDLVWNHLVNFFVKNHFDQTLSQIVYEQEEPRPYQFRNLLSPQGA